LDLVALIRTSLEVANNIANWNASNKKVEVLDGLIERAGHLQGVACTFLQCMPSSA